MTAETERLVSEFQEFVHERVSPMDIVRRRVKTIIELLRHPAVGCYPLGTRLAFLKFKSFATSEIEAALEEVDQKDYLRFLEALQNGEPLEMLNVNDTRSATGVMGASSLGGAGGGGGGGVNNRDDLDPALPSSAVEIGDRHWRVGAMVYAFKGDCSYYPVPFVGLDLSRAEDTVMIRHQLPTGEYGPIQYLTAGFKGVVPDEFAPYELVTPGQTVIAEYPGAARGHFKEAVVLGKSPSCQPDGSYTVDLEWVHSSERVDHVEHRCIRLLHHPKRVQAEMRLASLERKQHFGSGQQFNSTTSFAVHEATQPPSALIQSVFSSSPQDASVDYVKNFVKVPHLDKGVQPRTIRTGAQFVAQYGQFYHAQSIKSFPMLPPCQVDKSMTGFGMQLGHLERYSLDHRFFPSNPILDLCDECYRKDAMFVDPDFPPSFYSITGGENEIPAGVVWRRCSEVFSKPRLFTVGSKALDILPGKYSPPWLTLLFNALLDVAEVEEMISPGADGWTFGVYSVKFFLDGRWLYTVVDDFIPCAEDTGEPLSCVSSSNGEIYCTILEKVLAKLLGSYSALRYSPLSSLSKAWEDMSSNTLEFVDHRLIHMKDSLCENLFAIVSAGTNAKLVARVKGEERFEEPGFVRDEWWIVDAISQYVPPGRRQSMYFFHVTRPTHVGKEVPYVESYREKFYSQFPSDAVDHFPTRGVRQDGVAYWISSADYFNIFDRSHLMWYYNNTQRVAVTASFAGRPACAPKMFGMERWLANPQLLLSFVQPTDVIIEVRLLDRRFGRPPLHVDGPAVLQAHLVRGLPVERALTEEGEYVASSQAVDLRDDEEARLHPSAVIRATLSGGNYVLIPSLAENAQLELLVKVFSVSAFYAKRLN